MSLRINLRIKIPDVGIPMLHIEYEIMVVEQNTSTKSCVGQSCVETVFGSRSLGVELKTSIIGIK